MTRRHLEQWGLAASVVGLFGMAFGVFVWITFSVVETGGDDDGAGPPPVLGLWIVGVCLVVLIVGGILIRRSAPVDDLTEPTPTTAVPRGANDEDEREPVAERAATPPSLERPSDVPSRRPVGPVRGPYQLPPNGWSNELHGPWQAMLMDITTERRTVFEHDSELRTAIARIVDTESFPKRMTRAVVADADGWIAFGYSTDPAFISAQGHTCWMGSEVGFRALSDLGRFDALDVALWEGLAREALGGSNWWADDESG